jgi:DHA1 family tetracycline resistance protein-like MFS transporter
LPLFRNKLQVSERLTGEDAVLSGNFLLLLITWILMNGASPISDTFSSKYFVSLGATPIMLSGMFFLSSLAIATVQFPGGYLADQHGRKWLVTVMTFGLTLCYLFFIFAPSWQWIVVGLVTQNLCLIYRPALFSMMIDSLHPSKRATGLNFYSVVTGLIAVPAPLIAGALVLVKGNYTSPQSILGMRIAYTIVFAAYVVASIVRLRLKETLPTQNQSERPNFLRAFRQYGQTVRESLKVWREAPKSAYYLLITSVGINSITAACQIFLVLYATETLKITGSQYAIAAAMMALGPMLPLLFAGFRMDMTGRKRYLLLGYLLYVPAMLLFVRANFYMLLVSFFLLGFANILEANGSQALLGDLIPRANRGRAFGGLQFFTYIAQAFVYLLVGFLYSYIGTWVPFALFAAMALPLGLIVALKISDPKNKEH